MTEDCISKLLRKSAAMAFCAMVASAASSGSVQAAECEDPEDLTFAMIPTEETVAELQLYKPITDRMSELTGKKIQFFMPTSYASVVEGLLSGSYHAFVERGSGFVYAGCIHKRDLIALAMIDPEDSVSSCLGFWRDNGYFGAEELIQQG